MPQRPPEHPLPPSNDTDTCNSPSCDRPATGFCCRVCAYSDGAAHTSGCEERRRELEAKSQRP